VLDEAEGFLRNRHVVAVAAVVWLAVGSLHLVKVCADNVGERLAGLLLGQAQV